MASNTESFAEVIAEFGKNIELMRKCKCVGVSLWNCLKFKLRLEAAHKREVAELRKCLKEALLQKCDCKPTFKCEDCAYEKIYCHKWRKVLENTKGANDESK